MNALTSKNRPSNTYAALEISVRMIVSNCWNTMQDYAHARSVAGWKMNEDFPGASRSSFLPCITD